MLADAEGLEEEVYSGCGHRWYLGVDLVGARLLGAISWENAISRGNQDTSDTSHQEASAIERAILQE